MIFEKASYSLDWGNLKASIEVGYLKYYWYHFEEVPKQILSKLN